MKKAFSEVCNVIGCDAECAGCAAARTLGAATHQLTAAAAVVAARRTAVAGGAAGYGPFPLTGALLLRGAKVLAAAGTTQVLAWGLFGDAGTPAGYGGGTAHAVGAGAVAAAAATSAAAAAVGGPERAAAVQAGSAPVGAAATADTATDS